MKPNSHYFKVRRHFGSATGHLRGRQYGAPLRHLTDRWREIQVKGGESQRKTGLIPDWLADLTVAMVLLKTSCCLEVSRANRLLRLTLCTATGSTHTAKMGCWTTSRLLPVTTMTRPPLRTGSGHLIRTRFDFTDCCLIVMKFLRIEALCGRGLCDDGVVKVTELHAANGPLCFTKQNPNYNSTGLVTGGCLTNQLVVMHLLHTERRHGEEKWRGERKQGEKKTTH